MGVEDSICVLQVYMEILLFEFSKSTLHYIVYYQNMHIHSYLLFFVLYTCIQLSKMKNKCCVN